MLLADGGNIALTATSDVFTTAKWNDFTDFTVHSLVRGLARAPPLSPLRASPLLTKNARSIDRSIDNHDALAELEAVRL